MTSSLDSLTPALAAHIDGVFCDIDDTLTRDGRVLPEAFDALARLQAAGLRVIPVTGRPAGWVDHIARCWPVDGVVGENGGLWFYRNAHKLIRRFLQDADTRAQNRARLATLAHTILARVPGAALASDQPYRELDLAIDFCEDVPRLSSSAIAQIVEAFHEAGAHCKVSSIHVNGWFGDFDKYTGALKLIEERWGQSAEDARSRWIYVGDSPNDEPMFAAFPMSVGVANVRDFLPQMHAHPRWITRSGHGQGFAEFAHHLLFMRASTTR